MASWGWYSLEPENLSNHFSFKELPFENCLPGYYLTIISHRTSLVRLFIWHIALTPMKLGFAWFWPKSVCPELHIKFVRMKNIVVECPGTTISQSPFPRQNVFVLTIITFFMLVSQEKGFGKISPSFSLSLLKADLGDWFSMRALPPATHRWTCCQISPLTLFCCPQLMPSHATSDAMRYLWDNTCSTDPPDDVFLLPGRSTEGITAHWTDTYRCWWPQSFSLAWSQHHFSS